MLAGRKRKIERVTKEDLQKMHNYINQYKVVDGINAEETKEFYNTVKKLHENYNFLYIKCKELIQNKVNADMLEVKLAEVKIERDAYKKRNARLQKKLETEKVTNEKLFASSNKKVKTIDRLKKQLDDLTNILKN